jgi:hypothetical protein
LSKEPTIAEFMRPFRGESHARKVLAIGYYLEEYEGKDSFEVADIRQGYISAKLSPSSNISVEMRQNIKRDHMFCPQPGRYALTQAGLESIGAEMPTDEAREIEESISDKLRTDALGIVDTDEREYVEEALRCLGVGAYRGAILMGWAASMNNLYRKIQGVGFKCFYQACQQFMKNPRGVTRRSDLEYYRDSDVLMAAERIGLFDRNVRAALEKQLDVRNRCGHPGQVKPQIHIVNAFFEEIIQYVLSVT